MSSNIRPIGALLPTLNARETIAAHLAGAQAWLPLVREVVVVDSYSEDGTLDYLKQHLRHPNVRFLSHPRGLYQSWNFGLQQLTAPYAYIATVGDHITPDGLQHLVAVARELEAEVVLSRPELFDLEGRRILQPSNWPIHRLLQDCPLDKPRRLEPWQLYLLACLDIPRGILGSSASNLYRTEAVLRSGGFPTGYGHAGDTAWAIANAFQTVVAVTPRVFSRFVVHPNAATGMDPARFRELLANLFDLAERSGSLARAQIAADDPAAQWLGFITSFPRQARRLRECQEAYNNVRRSLRPWPWIFSRAAWRARAGRNRERRRLLELAAQLAAAAPPRPDAWDRALLSHLSQTLRELC
jgi:hypothetical protein